MTTKYLPLEDLSREQAVETLHLALKEAKLHLTGIELAHEILRVFKPEEVRQTLANLRNGKYYD